MGGLIPPLIGGIRFEYAHRVMAALVSILTLILAAWLTGVERRPIARRLGWTALALVLAQAGARRAALSAIASNAFGDGARHARADLLYHRCGSLAVSEPLVAARSLGAG